MTVLITGGAGFVGLNATAAFLAQGESVVIFGPAPPPAAAEHHLRSLPGRLAVAIGDVRDRAALAAAITAHGVDRLVHAAAITAGLARESLEAATIAAVNLGGTIEVLEAALACGIRRVIQLGTGSIFGARTSGEALDETHPAIPDSLYGITKYAAERTALRYRETRGLDIAVGRLGVVFGRWEYDTGVRDTLSLPLQLHRVAAAGGVARFRPGLPDDWVYATDVAAAILALMQAPRLAHDVYHLATGQRWSIPGWCDRLRAAFPNFTYDITDDEARLTVGAAAPNTRPPFLVDRLRQDTGFTARFDPAAAFDDYLAWHRGMAAAP